MLADVNLSASTALLFVGLLFNFVALIVGGLTLAWSMTRAFAQISERIAALEVHVKDLRRVRYHDEASSGG